ncbi:hypothetical protein H4R20_000582 [Coemansia guatemalensis]|uniref:Uncharacterized protein n=1 Tax=Coemansia guatemalensis TaxID=2761395 RepID=A0A9W8LVP8_9FUNG|nr:hypothetical protein H4R20_000582 [Coemansia guatemalensis]
MPSGIGYILVRWFFATVALKRAMRKILRHRDSEGAPIGKREAATSAGSTELGPRSVQRSRATPSEASRRSSASRPATDILSHLQELKAKERQVLTRGAHSTPAPANSTGAGDSNADEMRSRQERVARDERLAAQYREQLQSRLQEINDTAIDMGHQKSTMIQFERQLLGSSSPRELEQLELDRVNGVRSLIGLPTLPPLPPAGSGSVRQSRPGTPLYVGMSPSSPSPYSQQPSQAPRSSTHTLHRSHRHQHQRSDSFGENPNSGPAQHATSRASRGAGGSPSGDDDEEQDMDIEEGEISEEGELLE